MPGELATAGGVNRGGHTTIIFGDIVLLLEGALRCAGGRVRRGWKRTTSDAPYQLQEEVYERDALCVTRGTGWRIVDKIAI